MGHELVLAKLLLRIQEPENFDPADLAIHLVNAIGEYGDKHNLQLLYLELADNGQRPKFERPSDN